ncbi:MAG TPA: tetratricopeptide repeat protein [Gammaproteobacteria bacterium]|nr:tetratricopeptide repeat protein [Gammaproteobacteria bacterium]
MYALFWLLLPVAAISGWIAATRHFKTLAENNQLSNAPRVDLSQKGLANLVDTQPDNAVDIVIDKLEVSPETVEVHLALGKLYRQSGEVNRAIRFHQNLIEKHALSHEQRESILFELGRDYVSAGLLDRAERIFKDLLTTDAFKISSSKALVDVYQQEKDWRAALEYAEMYQSLSGISQKTRIGQYCCEQAEKIAKEDADNISDVKTLLELALKKDKSCVRAYMLLGDLYFKQQAFDVALKHYVAAVDQDRNYLSVVLENVVCCFQQVPQKERRLTLLANRSERNLKPATENSLVQDEHLILAHNKTIKYIEQTLEKTPTLSLLSEYLQLSLDDLGAENKKYNTKIINALTQINRKNASYKCVSCGLGVHALHWQCPSCANWSTIKPL